jgi:hypothetical protein
VTNYTEGLRTADKQNARSSIITQIIAQGKEPTEDLVNRYMSYMYPDTAESKDLKATPTSGRQSEKANQVYGKKYYELSKAEKQYIDATINNEDNPVSA